MKLYYSRGACSLTPHILLRETGVPFTLVRMESTTHRTEHDEDFYAINPKGYVPVLEFDDGGRLTEGPVICQYICDLARRIDLMPAAGTMPRYRVMEWQGYINSEIHKGYSPLFSPDLDAAVKAGFAATLRRKYEWISSQLEGKDHLTGNTFTAADAYLFNVTRWARYVKVDLTDLEPVTAFMRRVAARPAVVDAFKAEGLRS
ncbi:MAG TPA: glutathione transferase GstA [Gammaproteobacteria bacterium]|jgi:glutathione S-transferase|nr:glutathione transferase GstA [Gammaproteobacteria bacterium]